MYNSIFYNAWYTCSCCRIFAWDFGSQIYIRCCLCPGSSSPVLNISFPSLNVQSLQNHYHIRLLKKHINFLLFSPPRKKKHLSTLTPCPESQFPIDFHSENFLANEIQILSFHPIQALLQDNRDLQRSNIKNVKFFQCFH